MTRTVILQMYCDVHLHDTLPESDFCFVKSFFYVVLLNPSHLASLRIFTYNFLAQATEN
jgi:hypothetical protein